MRKLSFTKLCPGGNPTVFLDARAVPDAERALAASRLMSPLHVYAEQAGFIDLAASPPRLDMMGGEFCLNAARSLAYEMLRKRLFFPLRDTEDLFGLISCSGLEEPLQVRARQGKSADPDMPVECFVTLHIELGADMLKPVDEGAVIARMPGITHLLLDESAHPAPSDVISAAKEYMDAYALLEEPACGIIWHKDIPWPGETQVPRGKFASASITPVIHVAKTDSYVAESACGSGTLALALTRIPAEGPLFMQVLQPSGETLRARLEAPSSGSRRCKAEAGGWVRLVAEGTTQI